MLSGVTKANPPEDLCHHTLPAPTSPDPVQISAKDMEPARLKAEFGERVAFWGGGVDSQHVLPRGTPAEVRENVRQNLAAFKPGGGYVFNNVHNIQADVPPENILAMYDAAWEFGEY